MITSTQNQNVSRHSTQYNVRRIAFVGIFGAIAAVLMFIEFPLFFAPSFYQLDFTSWPPSSSASPSSFRQA